MKKLKALFQGAKKSAWGLTKLNWALWFIIPFNKPHRIKVTSMEDNRVETLIPYKRSNLNHIKGIHACGMATAAEFSSGLLLLSRLDPAQYRIIMKDLRLEYLYQGKSSITATFELSEEALQQKIITPLKDNDAIYFEAEIKLADANNTPVAIAYSNWQIKDWTKVKTKID